MEKRYIYLILFVVLLAFTVRITYLIQTKDNPLFYPVNNGLDPSLYHQRAQLIVQNGLKLPMDFVWGMPGYPYFLAVVYKLFGENIFAVRLIQMLLGTFNCLLIYFISSQLFNRRSALISMSLYALYGMFIFYEGMLLGVTLTIFLNCLIMLLLFSIRKETSCRKWFLLALLVGLCSLIWAGILLFVPFILIWFNFTRPLHAEVGFTRGLRLKRTLISQLVFCATVICVIVPITIRNYLIAGDFIPITAHGGINFYIGNNPQADGSFKPPNSMHISAANLMADSIREAQERTGRKMKPSEVSRFWFTQSIRFIQRRPLTFLKLLLRKTALLFNAYEIFDIVDYSFFRKKFSTVLNLPLTNLRVIFPLALLGVCLSVKDWRRRTLVYLFLISSAISIVAYFVNARYRLPLIFFLIIFAGHTLDWWLMALRQKRFKDVFLSLGVLPLFFLATNIQLTEQSYVSQYNNLGVSYKQAGEFELAIEAYEEALKINPNQAQTHNNLGNLYNKQGLHSLGVYELKRAIELDPNLAEAHSNLGIVYTKIGKIDDAVAEYKEALRLRPNLVTAHYNLALMYQKKAKLGLAAEEFRQTIQHAPDHANAYNNLGVIYLKQKLYKLARQCWQEALKINPELWQAKENLKKLKY